MDPDTVIRGSQKQDSHRCYSHTIQSLAQEMDIIASIQLFDKDGTGSVSKHEFVQGVEVMKTFAK